MKLEPVIVRPKVPTKMDAWKPDNGHMHYGVGVRGSYCGVEVEHRETAECRSRQLSRNASGNSGGRT
jgi:hypothetical protein